MSHYSLLRQVLIKKTTPSGIEFNDAIYMSDDEFAAKTEADIQALVDARFAAFVEATKPVVDNRKPEEVIADEIAAFTEAKEQAQKQADEYAAYVAKKEAELAAIEADK